MKWKYIAIFAIIIVLVAAAAISAVVPLQAFKDNEHLPWVQENMTLGLDLQGGVHVVLQAKDTPDAKVTDEAMQSAKATIENRVNQLGVAEPLIQIQGQDRLIVELAGIEDPEQAVIDMIQTAYLEFKTAEGTTVLTGRHLEDAREAREPMSGAVTVNLAFNREGAQEFARVTQENVGRPIGIYLDGELLQAPVVREPIRDGRAEITGYGSLEEAHRMAILLRSGALPVKLEVLEKRTVGPQLGADSLNKSLNAGIVGLIAIVVFMAVYYRVPGMIANLALIIYTLIVLAVLIGINATMTLPGIAGFILSMGIAVDANVIIFERIKEELRSGKALRSAVNDGFKRGFTAIFDANVTTLLVALVLYYFAASGFRGFAVILSIGILASMFTAITLTRWMLHLVVNIGFIKNRFLYGA